MAAIRAGFVTRAQAGLRAPRSVSRNITPRNGGVGVHYGGGAQRIRSHAECIARWRSWQNFHMSPGWAGTKNGGADIAYNFGFCDHGYVFAGRGLGTRSAGNGTNSGNQNFYAAVWIGGEGERPSKAALDALDWIVLECRNNGAGSQVRPHSWFKSTACPGNPLRSYLPNVHNKAIGASPSQPPPPLRTGPLEALMSNLTDREQRIATQFLKALAASEHGDPDMAGVSNGASFYTQLVKWHRMASRAGITGDDLNLLAGIGDGVEHMRPEGVGDRSGDYFTAGRSFALAAVALWREAGARAWLRSWDRFRQNRAYTDDDLK